MPVVDGVSRVRTGAADADVAQTGALVYRAGGQAGAAQAFRTLVWVDREGNEEAVPAPPHAYQYPRVSPDGTRLVVNAQDGEQDLWVWDFARETLTRLTFTPEQEFIGVWMPNGERIIFDSGSLAGGDLFWRAADGTGTVERLTDSPLIVRFPQTLSSDGTHLVYQQGTNTDGTADLYTLSLDDERRSEPLIATGFREKNAEVSPDGRWVAYESDASGQFEVYVQPFPNVDDGKWQISTMSGWQPLWGPGGRELFYRTEAGVMSVNVETAGGFTPGTPALVVEGQYFRSVNRAYDISPDGQQFLMLKERAAPGSDADDPFAGLTQIHVVQNWFQELLERVPVP